MFPAGISPRLFVCARVLSSVDVYLVLELLVEFYLFLKLLIPRFYYLNKLLIMNAGQMFRYILSWEVKRTRLFAGSSIVKSGVLLYLMLVVLAYKG